MSQQKDINYEENQKKKEYLRGYEKAVHQMERSALRISEIRLSKACPSVANDGMPHTHNNNDLSSYVALLEQEEKQYIKYRNQRIKKCNEITEKIEQLENEDEKDVLFYRYIQLMKWEEICNEMQCSWRKVHRIHIKALNNIVITE